MNTDLYKGYWWEQDETRLSETIFGIVTFLQQNQKYRQDLNLRHMRLYGNMNTLGLSAYNYAQVMQSANTDRLTLNIIQSCVDTVNAKVAKSTPKPTFLTSDGDYKKKRKAKKLSRFALGQLYETKMFEQAPMIARDGMIFGTGAGKIYRQGATIVVERTFIDEILVDDSEAMYGQPMNLYQTKFIAREVAMRAWPEHAAKIKYAKKATSSHPHHSSLSDMIMVVEAWHKATRDDAGEVHGGKHVICFENVTVLEEEYKRTYFPFVFYRWNKPLLGFFGNGLGEQLTGIQIEINKLLKTAQLAFHTCGIPQYWVDDGTKIAKGKINNEVGAINRYSGQMPTLVTPPPIHPAILQQIDKLYGRAFEIAGVSQLSASSQKPAGLDSGKALREFLDNESERFLLAAKAYEDLFMDATRQFLDLGQDISKVMKESGQGDYKVKVHDRKFMDSIPWSEVDMSEDEYVMQIFPTSLLSSTPSGRLSDVQEMTQAGMIPPDYAAELLDFPDLDSFLSLKNAAIEDIERTIESLVDGNYQAPEPYQNLQMGIQMMQSAYLKYRDDTLEESSLELMRRWMEEASQLLNPPQQMPMGPEQGIPGAEPQAAPEPTPTSNMVPNVPGAMPQQ